MTKKRIVTCALTIMLAWTVPLAGTANAARSPSRACLAALDQAEQIASYTHELTLSIGDYFAEQTRSAQANANRGIAGATATFNDIAAAARVFTAETEQLTPKMAAAVAAYRSAARRCRTGR